MVEPETLDTVQDQAGQFGLPLDPREVRDLQVAHEEMRAASSILLNRVNFATQAGLTFNGQRDTFKALGYKKVLLPDDYRQRYLRNGVAASIVEALPKATWRGGAELIEDDEKEELTPFETAWAAFNQRLNVWRTFMQADTLCGIGRFAIILIGAPGDVNTALPTKLDAKQIMYLAPFYEGDALVSKFEIDTTNPRFGMPVEYMLRRQMQPNTIIQPPTVGVGRPVHYSRVIHVADNMLDDRVYGIPRLERVWNLLDDLEKITGGGSEAFWKRADAGMHFKLDPMLKTKPEDITKMKEEVEDYTNKLKRNLTTRGVDIDTLNSSVADFKAPSDALMGLISAATRIPQRILTGSERGELASTQDRANWEERVMDRRHEFAGPMVVRVFVDRMIQLGVLPTPAKYDVAWPEVASMTLAERAETAVKWDKVAHLSVNEKRKLTGNKEYKGDPDNDPQADIPTGLRPKESLSIIDPAAPGNAPGVDDSEGEPTAGAPGAPAPNPPATGAA